MAPHDFERKRSGTTAETLFLGILSGKVQLEQRLCGVNFYEEVIKLVLWRSAQPHGRRTLVVSHCRAFSCKDLRKLLLENPPSHEKTRTQNFCALAKTEEGLPVSAELLGQWPKAPSACADLPLDAKLQTWSRRRVAHFGIQAILGFAVTSLSSHTRTQTLSLSLSLCADILLEVCNGNSVKRG